MIKQWELSPNHVAHNNKYKLLTYENCENYYEYEDY